MAKLSIPGKTPPAVAILLKHHFWLLAVLIPLVLVPLLLLAQGSLREQITAMQAQIKGAIDGLRGVRRIPQHPNSSWASEIDASTKKVKLETYAEWKKFWDSQQALRVWPAKQLGADFVKAVEALKPGGNLPRPMLERYQDRVRVLVRELPGIMGVENAMTDSGEAAGGPPGGGRLGRSPRPPMPGPGRPGPGMPSAPGLPGEGAEVSPYFLTWNAQNQSTIYSSFNWETPPTTTKVLLAQEELRVYAVLCDIIARMNKTGTGPHNVAIAAVDELFVGYPAAEDNPGGAGGGRVTVIAQASADPSMGMAPPDMPAPGMEGAAAGRPPHPRFTGAVTGGMPAGGEMPGDMAAAEPVSPDEQLRNWIYVDFNGKPLTATELSTAVDSQMIHLMPYVLRIVIDQRQIDALLTALATAALPIDVRQLRINAAGGATGAMAGGMPPIGPVAGGESGGSRLYDVTLEIRGSVGLATEPNEQTVGLEPGEGQPAAPTEAEGKPAAKAAAIIRRELTEVPS